MFSFVIDFVCKAVNDLGWLSTINYRPTIKSKWDINATLNQWKLLVIY